MSDPQQFEPLRIDGQLWFNRGEKGYLGGKRIELLVQIEETGSITRAAKAVKLSYKAAWDAVDTMNNLSERPLVVRAAGGAKGGGTQLTEFGREMLHVWQRMQHEYERFLSHVARGIDGFEDIDRLLRAIAMKTSARNQFRGRITYLEKGAVNGSVSLDIGHGQTISATLTNDSIDELQLAPGKMAMALIKASFVLLSPDPEVKISARNRLTGTISGLTAGTVSCEVRLKLEGDRTLGAVITNESAETLGLAIGQPCTALIKASHVIIAID
ncbi:LysR family transcriptional regulator [Stutzerimonas zhaodongensis]|uniref:LysR family transcriptional regulator n=1 Tax=Stutzerimonas zhaodongensis TaxID=1176257 RepID=A0A3M2HN71_9GAMM|nr:TOBE domain-containing protein [Stutzerimonas zhaodongensis]MCQ4316135.1 TOBE domain-containing protein [Stutzerimonas zhaodongensis]RMH89805.1 LysR family transcriptional regulator [Stutzerimonas zhaodongensis]